MSVVGKRKEVGYIIPFAKMRGETSFASIGLLKRLLGTRKLGHTGTLDSFADGLLVAVSGKLTRLASFIEAGLKRYEALIVFGSETDTLDPTGEVLRRTELPTYEGVQDILNLFVGKIMQVPPQFSALHVNGRRASDIVRSGGSVELEGREVDIKDIVVKGALFDGDYAFVDASHFENHKGGLVKELHVEVECSKGTYIRALARDIGKRAGSLAHLKALRRLSVACFSLQDAFRSSCLPSFLSKEGISPPTPAFSRALNGEMLEMEAYEELARCAKEFSPSLCEGLQLPVLEIKRDFVSSFAQGKEVKEQWFCNELFDKKSYNVEETREAIMKKGVGFVFCENEALGAITLVGAQYKYKFVL